jgi:hypothetical protein
MRYSSSPRMQQTNHVDGDGSLSSQDRLRKRMERRRACRAVSNRFIMFDADGVGSASAPVTLVNVPQPDQLRRRHDRQHNGEGSSSTQSAPMPLDIFTMRGVLLRRNSGASICDNFRGASALVSRVVRVPSAIDRGW